MTGSVGRVLGGKTVVVTRAVPGELDERLDKLGARVIAVPAIAFVDPDDEGRALGDALDQALNGSYSWVVVSSATAVSRVMARPESTRWWASLRASVAAIGPATAKAVRDAGGSVDFVPDEAVGESFVDQFPDGEGRVLLLRPESTRDVIATGLRSSGWEVDDVATYRTVAVDHPRETIEAVGAADAITFLSPSAAKSIVGAVGPIGLPPVVVSIGPVTSDALRQLGVSPTAQADPHTVDGVVSALERAMR